MIAMMATVMVLMMVTLIIVMIVIMGETLITWPRSRLWSWGTQRSSRLFWCHAGTVVVRVVATPCTCFIWRRQVGLLWQRRWGTSRIWTRCWWLCSWGASCSWEDVRRAELTAICWPPSEIKLVVGWLRVVHERPPGGAVGRRWRGHAKGMLRVK